MKRKLALMLAAVMTLSTLPSINLFAAASTYVSRSHAYLPDTTVMSAKTTGTVAYTPVGDYDTTAVQASNLVLEANSTFTAGETFTLSLNNADWFFRGPVSPLTTAAAYGVIASADAVGLTYFAQDTATVTGAATSIFVEGDASNNGAAYPTYTSAAAFAYLTGGVRGYEGVLISGSALTGTTGTADYYMAVNGSNAYVTVLKSTLTHISIPLVLVTDDEEVVTSVTVSNNAAGVAAGTFQIVGGVAGGTIASFDGVASGRDKITLKPLMIKETRTNTIKSSGTGTNATSFRIAAPTGYDFVVADTITNLNTAGNVKFIGLGAAAATPFSVSNVTKSLITVTMENVTPTSSFNGQIDIDGIVIEARSSSTWGDVTGLRIYGDQSGIDDASFTAAIATRVDYGVTLKAASEKEGVPELFTGVMPSAGAIGRLGEKTHKLMEVTIVENAKNSWWTTRKTTLTLPDGVLVRAVEVTDKDKLVTAVGKGEYADENGPSVGSSGLITFDGNEIEIGDVKDTSGDKASLTLNIWVSISNRMAGKDITLEVSGGGMSGTDLPDALVVATAKAPITIETKVSNVAIGRNSQATADITIIENGIGALANDEELLVVMTDYYGDPVNTQLGFTGASFEVTEGDLEISGSRKSISGDFTSISGSGGQLSLTVDAESRKTASTILITGVTVSTATTLPSAEKNPYQILVYGSAVAANFDSTKSATNAKEQGFFRDITKDAGVFADYVKTTSATSQGGYDPQSVFSLATTGDIVYTIDGATFTADADMVPFNENGTIYVSLRLIAEAFGTTPVWSDANKSATILAGSSTIAKFVKDSEFMVTGLGEPVPMVDANYQNTPAIIRNDRLFVPFRWMGIAMGVSDENISWDDETKTVWFNK